MTEEEKLKKKVDLNILILRKIHGFCYYCCEEYDDERTLSNKCDWLHLRSSKVIGSRNDIKAQEFKKEYAWDKHLNLLISRKIEECQTRAESGILEIDFHNDKSFQDKLTDFFNMKILRQSQDKYECKICSKVNKLKACFLFPYELKIYIIKHKINVINK